MIRPQDPSSLWTLFDGFHGQAAYDSTDIGAHAHAEGAATAAGSDEDDAYWVQDPTGDIATANGTGELVVVQGAFWSYTARAQTFTVVTVGAVDGDSASGFCLASADSEAGYHPDHPISYGGVQCSDNHDITLAGSGGIWWSEIGDADGNHVFLVPLIAGPPVPNPGAGNGFAWDDAVTFSNDPGLMPSWDPAPLPSDAIILWDRVDYSLGPYPGGCMVDKSFMPTYV